MACSRKRKQEVLQRANSLGIKFVRMQFTDILGVVKNVAIPVDQLDKALDDEIMFDGSSIEGFTRIEESDQNLRPDPDSFTPYPWRDEAGVARLICDVYLADGQPFTGDPRFALKRVLRDAEQMGYRVNVGTECEFFLFELDDDGQPTTRTNDRAGYFDLGPVDRGEDARRDIVLALAEMGFEVEASHHEVAPGQHEIGFRYGDALVTADRVTTFKVVTRAVAATHNLHATFMPKPIVGINGSGMHTHFSLFKDDQNAFFDPEGEHQLSDTARHFIGGILEHAPGFTAVTNPLVNSFKRLVPGYEAPVYVSWSAQNRSALVRVPASRDAGTRVELRSPDPSCNPYLAFAATIAAGLDGIRKGTEPPPSMTQNIYRLSKEERTALHVGSLPDTLQGATHALLDDDVVVRALGDHIVDRFVKAKTIEWDVYRSQVHQWEIDQYLTTF